MFETELQRMSQLASLVVVVLGLWVVVTPWFWGGGAGFFGEATITIDWLFWSNTVAGLVIAGIAAQTALQIEKEIKAG